jgi:hypothetical protein
MVGKNQKSHGARSELNSVFGLEKVDRWNPIRTFAIQSRSRPVRFPLVGTRTGLDGAPKKQIRVTAKNRTSVVQQPTTSFTD